jgi:hypothetical protein
MWTTRAEPGLVARVAAGAFDLDAAQLTVPPLDGGTSGPPWELWTPS